jgi:hypothetical protein
MIRRRPDGLGSSFCVRLQPSVLSSNALLAAGRTTFTSYWWWYAVMTRGRR